MTKHKHNSLVNYEKLITRFKVNLLATLAKPGPKIGLGDREIEVSQRMADELRSDISALTNREKSWVTVIHSQFVKWVWTL